MNELQRQSYLTAFGLDNYMPRFVLPFAPPPQACDIQSLSLASSSNSHFDVPVTTGSVPAKSEIPPQFSASIASSVESVIGPIFDVPKKAAITKAPITAADILSQLDTKPKTIESFSLSVWRPINGLLIVDSRNTKLALLTELFLRNILRSQCAVEELNLREEVLRWPAIENSFSKRTAIDARNELQTWLSVQQEIRPFRLLLLMGYNAATYLLPDNSAYEDCFYKTVSLIDSAATALVTPSLNEILQNPSSKRSLYIALQKIVSTAL